MFNNTGIKKETLGAPVQILFNVQNQMSVGVKVSKDITARVTEGTRKIVKAGTPLAGDLTQRETAFTEGGAGNAVGVLLHDVDVTNGDANGTLLIWGFVNLNRVDETTRGSLEAVKEDLEGKIWLLKD